MPQLRLKPTANQIRAFCAGFVLGAAFMASPALGFAVAVIAVFILSFLQGSK